MQIPVRPRRAIAPGSSPGRARAVPDLTYRARKILYALVTEYVATGEPVGSRTLSKRYGLNLSAATIRNELTDLEDAGCVAQPHTSAGRVPTELGFRVFIDALAQMRDVSDRDRAAVLARMKQLRPGVDDVVREAARMLASLSGAAAVVSRRADREAIAHLRFMPLGERRLLVVIVWQSGAVQNRVIEIAEALHNDELERLHNYLRELAGAGDEGGRSLAELRTALAEAVAKERDAYDGLRRRAKEIVEAALATPSAGEDALVIEGQGALFDRREFSDPEKIRRFLRTFEERERLLGLLDRTIAAGGVQVLVGSEAELDAADDVGVISSTYRANGVPTGSLGVIGPSRLDYAKLMPLVGFTAQVVSDVLDGHSLDEAEDEDVE
ncbi:MAG: heat-inducible transcriptional repressor HrcA [Sandaracinaceae bacterium]|jgi:heat-inducible transcriptional repressor|nr:heat-inducible transcriptional repressor HrcA [Sandaracinaceae bacterium]